MTRTGQTFVLALALCASALIPAVFASGQLDGIAGVGDDAEAEPEVVGGDAVRESVSLTLYVDRAEIAQRLLDGIDAHVRRADVAGKQLAERRFPAPWEPGEYVEGRRSHRRVAPVD